MPLKSANRFITVQEGAGRGNRTGPYTIVGMVRQSSGAILLKIKSATREQLAHESELKLALKRE